MNVLRFKLQGKTAFFKKPDVNANMYFTYGNIHKVALLGIFGAILGYGGYNQKSFNKKYCKEFKDKNEFPEFYNRLSVLKIAVEPIKASFSKKVQTYNNSVGYASKEQGGNLIIKEQWIEDPCWYIYVKLDNEESMKLCSAIENEEYVFIPYLGKNDHFADISEVKVFKVVEESEDTCVINSLFKKSEFEILSHETADEFDDFDEPEELTYKYEEKLPVELEEVTNKYELESVIYTNQTVRIMGESKVYNVYNKKITFI